MEKMYRLEMPDYTIEGDRKVVVYALNQMDEKEIYQVKLYYLIPKKFLCFSYEIKQRVSDEAFSRLLRTALGKTTINV